MIRITKSLPHLTGHKHCVITEKQNCNPKTKQRFKLYFPHKSIIRKKLNVALNTKMKSLFLKASSCGSRQFMTNKKINEVLL